MNTLRVALLLAGMTALFVAIGRFAGGTTGMVVALAVAVAVNFGAWWASDRLVLRLYKARQVEAQSAPQLYEIVERLARHAGVPTPRVYVIDTAQPNAFATGRGPDSAAVAATTGLLRLLNAEELTGVMAHELAHIRHRDTLTATLVATLAGAIGMLANGAFLFGGSGRGEDEGGGKAPGVVGTLLLSLLAPLAAVVVQTGISRSNEYAADEAGARLCGQPLWLANALEKLETGSRAIDNPRAENNPGTAHLFIVNPLHVRSLNGLFSTHPRTADRIARLRAMAGIGGMGTLAAVGPWG